MSKGRVVLVTGGAGSLGSEVCRIFSRPGNTCGSVRVFDNHEPSLARLKKRLGGGCLRYIYGDVRDYDSVYFATRGVDVVVHCAALKNIEVTEYNVDELVQTNIIGTLNLVKCAIENGVRFFVYVSTDKAVEPVSSYGVSKLMGEYIVRWAAGITNGTGFCIFRSGNFCDSAGNVFEVWKRQHDAGEPLTVTNLNATRYFIDTSLAARLISHVCDRSEVFSSCTVVPVMKEYMVSRLIEALYPSDEIKVVGLRDGEKMRESLFHSHESPARFGDIYVCKWR